MISGPISTRFYAFAHTHTHTQIREERGRGRERENENVDGNENEWATKSEHYSQRVLFAMTFFFEKRKSRLARMVEFGWILL